MFPKRKPRREGNQRRWKEAASLTRLHYGIDMAIDKRKPQKRGETGVKKIKRAKLSGHACSSRTFLIEQTLGTIQRLFLVCLESPSPLEVALHPAAGYKWTHPQHHRASSG